MISSTSESLGRDFDSRTVFCFFACNKGGLCGHFEPDVTLIGLWERFFICRRNVKVFGRSIRWESDSWDVCTKVAHEGSLVSQVQSEGLQVNSPRHIHEIQRLHCDIATKTYYFVNLNIILVVYFSHELVKIWSNENIIFKQINRIKIQKPRSTIRPLVGTAFHSGGQKYTVGPLKITRRYPVIYEVVAPA